MKTAIAPLIIALFAVAWPGTSLAVSVEDVPNPRHQGKWVTDLVDMLDPAQEQELNSLIESADRELSVEIAVVTVDTVDTATPKDFATELFNAWGIGKADTDNGLLVLMVKGERRLEMETGYGTESVLTDGWLKSMQEAEMVPRFKEGKFGDGLYEGVRISIERMRDQREGLVSDQSYSPSLTSRVRAAPWWAWLTLVFGGFGVGGVGVKRRLDRTCKKCKKKMSLLPDDQDDKHLEPGQQTEEQIGSVDWEYWFCDTCGNHRLLANEKWFSGYSRCGACNRKTMSVEEQTISAPSYTSSGTAQVTSDCRHCHDHRTWTRTLPQLQQSTSSSSSSSGGSSGGSFGGGSSGGGGAGSSW